MLRKRDTNAPRGTAYEALVRILARRSHSRAELLTKLRARGYPREEIQAAVERALELGQHDDDAHVAERYAAELSRKTGATPAWVSAKLRAKGLDDGSIRTAVRAAFQGWDARLSARKLVAGLRDPAKVARRLESRGFEADVIHWVVGQIREAGEED